MNNTITLNEFKENLKYLIGNNKRLVENGERPISIGCEGPAGLGKTESIRQVAEELGYGYVRLNLAELEEVSDLVGFPLKEYKTTDGNWIPVDLINHVKDYIEFTGESRMSYAAPSWLPPQDGGGKEGWIITLDDFSRANSLFIQASMTLIQLGEYISWKLPKNTNIILSTNPDDGSYNINSQDPAQLSRYICFPIRFCIDDFARWAESNEIDNRAINFAISYSTEIFENENQLATINPRSFTMFARAISGIKNWQDPKNLALILNISKGCFRDPDNIIGNLFTTFIANKLDQLISPKDMLLEKWETVYPKIKNAVYDENGEYRPAIAAILHTRLLNYTDYYFSQEKAKTETVMNRLMEILHSETTLFDQDIIFNIVKTLFQKYPARMQKEVYNSEIREIVLS